MTPSTLSLTDHAVLGLIVEEPRHGFAVARELGADGSIGQIWTVHRPLVYRSIDHLARSDLIEWTRSEPGRRGPDRAVYRATRRGRDRLARWLERPVEHPRQVRAELLVKLWFLARRGRSPQDLARAQLERFEPMSHGLEHAAAAAEGSDRLVALWRLETLRATNSLLRRLIDDPQLAGTGGAHRRLPSSE
ncbi:MAG: hypothetical protein AMXMBFR46_05040 [Acidimicrobiia bacterium]